MNEYKIEDLLFEELILMDQEASDYEDLITQIGELAFEKGYVDKEFSKAVIEREKLYPTGLPTNKVKVAIPHAMVRDNVKKSAIIISKLKKPVLFKEMGSSTDSFIPVDIVFLLAVNGSKDQLTILQKLVGMFSDDDAMVKLNDMKTASDTIGALKEILSQ